MFTNPFVPPIPAPVTTGDVIQNQVAYATYTIFNANEFLGLLQDSIKTDAVKIDPQNLANPDFATLSLGWLSGYLNLLGGINVAAPTITPPTGVVPTAPAPVFSPVPAIEVPTLAAAAPTLIIPSPPNVASPSIPGAPALEDVSLPTAPSYVLPAAPTFNALVMPQLPSITLPTFNSTLPIESLIVPTNTFSWYETAYTSSLLDAAKAKLLDNIQNGGYGIDITDESALWDRARSRELQLANAQIDEIYRLSAARGFPLPPGDLNVAVQRAMQDANTKISTANRDIALKRADLYVDNRKFTIQEVRQLETVLIGYYSSMQERSLNAAKAVLQLGIEVFNASVARYNAQLDAYKSEASVFESKIRAVLWQTEIYRTQMEGKRIELAAQTQQVELYRAQLAGINAIVDIYKTSVQAQVEKANVQRLKVESFRAQIDAYAAQVQSNIAAAQLFESQVRGEVAKVTAFEANVRAYATQVEAAKVKADTALGNLRVQIEQAQAGARIYEAQIAGFRANIDSQVEVIRAQLGKYQTDASVYATKGTIYGEAARVGINQAQLEGQQRSKALDIVIENARNQIMALKASADIKIAGSSLVEHYAASVVNASIGALQTLSAITTSK